MKAAVIGATGYSGEVLVRLLSRHPNVELAVVTSRQNAGRLLSEVLPALRGIAPEISFVDSNPDELAARTDIDVFFLALPHGAAAGFAGPLVKAGRRVIDLSADFRISNLSTYQDYYGTHPAPELLPDARFVLPEITPDEWRTNAKLVAAPGCYPTGVIVPLVPLIKTGVIDAGRIVVNSFSGVSGAGKKVAEMYLFVERAESARAYGLVKHRHLAEMEEQLSLAAGKPVVIQFNPHLAPMKRGIATTITVPAAGGSGVDAVYEAWGKAYDGRPFVRILPTGETPDTAHTVGTNRVDLSAVHDPRTGNFVITSAEDNLMKGASGQAVQIMNLWFGLPETAGLL